MVSLNNTGREDVSEISVLDGGRETLWNVTAGGAGSSEKGEEKQRTPMEVKGYQGSERGIEVV